MTNKELQDKLKQFPDDLTVFVTVEYKATGLVTDVVGVFRVSAPRSLTLKASELKED